MWLSRGLSRGCVRMRRIFSTGLTIIGWHRPFSASTEALSIKPGYTRPTSLEGQLSLPLPRAEASTISASHSISKYPQLKINGG